MTGSSPIQARTRSAPGPAKLDTLTFERLARQAAREREQGRPESASAAVRSALSLWRGPAFAGLLDLAPVAVVATKLEELRLTLFEDGVQLDLDVGRHAEVIATLGQMITEHPYRERLRGLQMLALYRSGRQADALDAYQHAYQQLAADLGVNPGVDLQRLQQGILSGDPNLVSAEPAAAAASTSRCRRRFAIVPAQLPPDPSGFVGRADQLAALDEAMRPAPEGSRLTVVTGTAGVGKTALIMHWAHQVRRAVPRRPAHVDLRGYSAIAPAQPLDVLARFLRACGMPGDRVPLDTEDATAAYRSLLADRRMLIVLDNASSAEQVRPLLPGGPGCAVTVTSRDRLDGLAARDGARRIDVGVLGRDEVPALLSAAIGADRVAAELAAVAELTARAGNCAGPADRRRDNRRREIGPGQRLRQQAQVRRPADHAGD